METFFDVIKIINLILDILLIALVIILTKRYKTLRSEFNQMIEYLQELGKLEIAKNEAELARNNYMIKKEMAEKEIYGFNKPEFTPNKVVLIPDFIDQIKDLLPDSFNVDYAVISGMYQFKIYPKGAHQDSGVECNFYNIEFDEWRHTIVECLKKFNYIKE